MAAAYTPRVMSEGASHARRAHSVLRTCARRGCGTLVKKPTAKYCSIRCCAIDPERHERLRTQARRAASRPLPMTRQLSMGFSLSTADPEAQLAKLCEGREDVPAGMSRLVG